MNRVSPKSLHILKKSGAEQWVQHQCSEGGENHSRRPSLHQVKKIQSYNLSRSPPTIQTSFKLTGFHIRFQMDFIPNWYFQVKSTFCDLSCNRLLGQPSSPECVSMASPPPSPSPPTTTSPPQPSLSQTSPTPPVPERRSSLVSLELVIGIVAGVSKRVSHGVICFMQMF